MATVAGVLPHSSYAAGVLQEMYGDALPHVARQLLRTHNKTRSLSEPAARRQAQWSTGSSERRAPRRRVELKVPRVGARKAPDTDEAPNRPPGLPTRKPLAQILQETSGYEKRGTLPPPARRDMSVEKRQLQDRNAFGFGSALPNTHAPTGLSAEATAVSGKPRRRVVFSSLPPSREGSPSRREIPKPQEAIAAEIVESVRERQRELDLVEEQLSHHVVRAEAPAGQVLEGRRALRSEMAKASQRRLELKNAISKDVKDLETLLDCTPVDGS